MRKDSDPAEQQDVLGDFVRQQPVGIDPGQELLRDNGILQKRYMKWQTKQKTLFQFRLIYTDRLQTLRKTFHLQSNHTIEDLSNDQKICQLVGLFKRLQEKRVRAFEADYEEKYKYNKPLFSQNDTYELQDQTSKIRLEIRPNTKINGSERFLPLETPYGVIIKCIGQYSSKLNRFILSNVETPKPAPQKRMKLLKGQKKFMMVVCEPQISDLAKILNMIRISKKAQNLNICELVIIGGLDYKNIHQIRQFDQILYQLGLMINTYIVPSSCDQTSHMFPLGPIPQILLKKAYQKGTTANCSNPQILESKLQEVELEAFISCGQNLLNLKANCKIQDNLELMKLIIEYRHACPSSVFSLPTLSYNYDPLILNTTPHLMIHGKCDIYQTQFYQRQFDNQSVKVRLVGLAKGDIVRIDLTSNVLETKKATQ